MRSKVITGRPQRLFDRRRQEHVCDQGHDDRRCWHLYGGYAPGVLVALGGVAVPKLG